MKDHRLELSSLTCVAVLLLLIWLAPMSDGWFVATLFWVILSPMPVFWIWDKVYQKGTDQLVDKFYQAVKEENPKAAEYYLKKLSHRYPKTTPFGQTLQNRLDALTEQW